MFLLELPPLGDSFEYTQYTIFNIKKKYTKHYPKSTPVGFFSRGRVRNNRGERASVLEP